MELVVRASQAFRLMTYKSIDKIEGTTLTYLKELAVQEVLGYIPDISSKYMEKGTRCEDESIELLNEVYNKFYQKNVERINTEGFTGECDIKTPKLIRDVKTSWSIDTFPFFQDDADAAIKKSGYDWQGRVYMMLYDVDRFVVDYCLIDTPDDLIGYENKEKHIVSFIPAKKRVTSVFIDRDEKIEALILKRWELANEKYKELVDQLRNK